MFSRVTLPSVYNSRRSKAESAIVCARRRGHAALSATIVALIERFPFAASFGSQPKTDFRRRNMKTRLFASLFLLASALFLIGCPSQTTVNKINGDPTRYRG